MKLSEIENLSHADLKAKRAELIEAIKGEPAAELAARYIQARTDAKMRDEKLSEQGETIKALQDGMRAAGDKIGHLQDEILKKGLEWGATVKGLQTQVGNLKGDVQTNADAFNELNKRARDLEKSVASTESLAKARRAALADVMQFAMQLSAKVAPLLATE